MEKETTGLWLQTRKVPLLFGWQRLVEDMTQALEKADAKEREHVEKLLGEARAVVERRTKNPSYHVEVRHVGSPEDPALWEDIATTFTAADHAALVAARRLLVEEFGSPEGVTAALDTPFAAAVTARAKTLPEYRKAFYALVTQRLEHGLVGGKEEVARLWSLGGWRLLLDAHEEVRRYQEVTPELGEG